MKHFTFLKNGVFEIPSILHFQCIIIQTSHLLGACYPRVLRGCHMTSGRWSPWTPLLCQRQANTPPPIPLSVHKVRRDSAPERADGCEQEVPQKQTTASWPFFFFKILLFFHSFFFIEVSLIYNLMLDSNIQHSGSY